MTTQAGDLEGRYANYFAIGYNAIEVVLDFGQSFADSDTPSVHTRIITSPIYARRLWKTLMQSLEQFEQAFGPIRDGEE
jgi:hypothetical protein